MKESVVERYRRLQKQGVSATAIDEDKVLYYRELLDVSVALIKSEHFFVSDFLDTDSDRLREVNLQYTAALRIPDIIEGLKLPLSELVGNMEAQHMEVLISEYNKKVRQGLDYCIKKGFNYPALKILEKLTFAYCGEPENEQSLLQPMGFTEVRELLNKIAGNYGKKEANKDDARYLSYQECVRTDKVREKETDIEYLISNLGRYGYYAPRCEGELRESYSQGIEKEKKVIRLKRENRHRDK